MPILTRAARLAGVIGWPVAYSRSPRLFGFWLARYGIDGTYVALPVAPGDLATALRGLAAAGFAGVNVTLPHKEGAFALADEVDEVARAAGSANTLVFRRGRIQAFSTDGAGFIANLRAHGVDPPPGPALLLGAGGAARAVGAALTGLGVTVSICNRTPERAAALAGAIPGSRVLAWGERSLALASHALVVNTTTLGMIGQPPLDLDLSYAAPGLVVTDLVYVPLETPLIAAARAAGLVTVGGLGMLLQQAVPGFAAWFGVTPEVDEEVCRFVADGLPAQ